MQVLRQPKYIAVLAALFAVAFPVPVQAQDEATERRVVRLVEQRCVKCHNDTVTNAGVDFSGFSSSLDVWKYRPSFRKALHMLQRGVMPPKEEPTLRDRDRNLITGWIEYTLNNVDIDRIPRDPGFVPPRRLTGRPSWVRVITKS